VAKNWRTVRLIGNTRTGLIGRCDGHSLSTICKGSVAHPAYIICLLHSNTLFLHVAVKKDPSVCFIFLAALLVFEIYATQKLDNYKNVQNFACLHIIHDHYIGRSLTKFETSLFRLHLLLFFYLFGSLSISC